MSAPYGEWGVKVSFFPGRQKHSGVISCLQWVCDGKTSCTRLFLSGSWELELRMHFGSICKILDFFLTACGSTSS